MNQILDEASRARKLANQNAAALIERARQRLFNAELQKDHSAKSLGLASLRAHEKPNDPDLQRNLAVARSDDATAARELAEAKAAADAAELENSEAARRTKAENDEKAWKTIYETEAKILETFSQVDRHLEKAMADFIVGVKLVNESLAICPLDDGTARDVCLLSEAHLLRYLKLKIRKCGSGGKTGEPHQGWLNRVTPWMERNDLIPDMEASLREGMGWLTQLSPRDQERRFKALSSKQVKGK